MTEGKIFKSIILYSLPLILGNFLQQLYNTFDALIVGNLISKHALGAVGEAGTISFFLVALYLGASSGAGILIAQHYGAKKYDELHKVIHNMIGIGIVLSVFITIIGLIFTPTFLRWIHTPELIFEDSVLYLRIYFSGMIFQVLYNMFAAVLNSVGNSKRALVYLAVSSVLNIGLDYLFIGLLGFGVDGAAYATVISQAVCCVLILSYFMRIDSVYHFSIRDIRLNANYVGKIAKVGIPAAVQNSVISFSTLLIQSGINACKENAVDGFTAFLKLDGFDILPILSFSMAATTFVGQNIGAGKYKRAVRGGIYIVLINFVYTLCTTALMLSLDSTLISIFNRDPEVIKYGVICIWALCPCYCLLGLLHSLAGCVRGTGNTLGPMIIILFSLCIFRIIWMFTFAHMYADPFQGVVKTYPFSFAVGAALMSIYTLILYFSKWRKTIKKSSS